MASSLDDFMANVVTNDTHKRLDAYNGLVGYLSEPRSSLQCENMDEFVDGLVAWMNSSNYKISGNGLEVLSLLIDRMGERFKSHTMTVLSNAVNRLGDNHDEVRNLSQSVLLKLMHINTPQSVWDRLMTGFSHKLWRVREETLICLQQTIEM
ncbi:CLIP-associating protein 1-like [Lingula anatina]|uniref:CLIP-associating protein 1-like n=1 Tax=Lingula anatina TaxID=7574 RepID=A0A1S3I056_LINAN|nr:CLIP-associating protein 1-like [Lingula anatina]|eukprot:XP_013391206.1 CLIP-associating protein 1-like [Lingula anatina]